MKNKLQEISELFLLFHDFTIVEVFYNEPILVFRIRIPWGQLWDDYDFEIFLELSGCHKLSCNYSELVKDSFATEENVFEEKSRDKLTTDPIIISQLSLSIQRFEFYEPNTFEFLCNGSPKIAEGTIEFTADNYRVFDNNGKEISFKQMLDWFEEFWKGDEIE